MTTETKPRKKPGPKPGYRYPMKHLGHCLFCGLPLIGTRRDKVYCSTYTCGRKYRRQRGKPS